MIVRTRGRDIELRSFALTDMVRYGYGDLRGAGPSMKEGYARGIPALHRAARLRAEAIAGLKLCCWRGYGHERARADEVWQTRLFGDRANPVQTRFGFWDTIGESLAWRNNAFIWKNIDPAVGRVIEWWALHPDQVTVKSGGRFKVTVDKGYVDPVGKGEAAYRVDTSTVLHIRGHGDGGKLEAPTPIQVFRDAMAAPVERQRHELRMWRRGTALQVGVEFPNGVTRQQADEWREAFRNSYEGTDGDTVVVTGAGSTIRPIGMTMQDAAFVAMAKLTVEDASRIMAVPASLLGVQLERAVPNLEQDKAMWLSFGLGPELERIESALVSDGDLFPPLGRTIYPKFDTEMFVRGDVATEATVLVSLVQAGILTPDEARHIRGLDELPDGIGAIPQITPVGGAPNLPPLTLPKKPAPAASNGSGN